MGLIPVGAIFKGFTFDGEDSKDYGVYISGEAVFNAPERAVDMVEIPGRSGAYALDLGRFENIEVRYPAGIAADNETDFASGISALRNFLASRRGYCRLEDEYNPDEYRLAVYKSGLEVTPAQLKAGEFEIVFDCMPQRFLKSGETAQTITSGGTLTNPTYFPAAPLLQVWGYGGILINNESISIANALIGKTVISSGGSWPISIDYAPANIGDDLIFQGIAATLQPRAFSSGVAKILTATVTSTVWNNGAGDISASVVSGQLVITYNTSALSAVYGTASVICEGRADIDIVAESTGGTQLAGTYRFTWAARIDASGAINRYWSHEIARVSGDTIFPSGPELVGTFSFGTIYADSTKSALGTPTIIDLDIGEAYYTSGADIISVNSAVTIPPQLPTLEPGANTITFDNTITQFKVVPRWWRV